MNTVEIVLVILALLLAVTVVLLLAYILKRKDTNNSEQLRSQIKQDIAEMNTQNSTTVISAVNSLGNTINANVKDNVAHQNENINDLKKVFAKSVLDNIELQNSNQDEIRKIMTEQMERNAVNERTTRDVLDKKLTEIATVTTARIEEINKTVNEKLEKNINERFTSSFKVVSDSLNTINRGFEQMQELSMGVTDLNKMLSNVKTRGVWGENSLDAILEDILTSDQYSKSVNVQGNNLVDFAVTLPGKDRGNILLPIDAKFPIEDYYRVIEERQKGNAEAEERELKNLENTVKKQARSIRDKYIFPPKTTNFALMFVPTESLYAEILQRGDLAEKIQNENRVVVVGPTTISALLNSLQLGFKTLAIQKSSEEIWKMFNQFRKDFDNFSENLDKVQKKLNEASNVIGDTSKRSDIIRNRLDKVEQIQLIEE